MLFHVRVELRGEDGCAEYEFGLTDKQLEQRILRPYRRGQSFLVDGKIIDPAEIERIRIARSAVSVETLMARAEAEERAEPVVVLGGPSLVNWIAFRYCQDITTDYITGPPGEKRRTRRKVQAPRRNTAHAKRDKGGDPPPTGLHIDESRFEVSFDGRSHVFEGRSKLLFALLVRLVRANGQAVKFDQLREKDDVWDGAVVEDSTIRGAITRLRNELRRANMLRLADSMHISTYQRRPYVTLNIDSVSGTAR